MQPPRLESARLILDAHSRDDFEDFAAMWADPEVVRHISGKSSTRQESWFRFMRGRGSWPIVGYGPWIIREKRTGRFVGEVGFADFQRTMEPPVGPIPEANWMLASWASGQGFATEALGLALEWLQGQGKYAQSFCLTSDVPTWRQFAWLRKTVFFPRARFS